MTANLKSEADSARELVLSILLLLLTVAALALLPYVAWRLKRVASTPQLVLESAKDGTGDTVVKEKLEGLSHRLREELGRQLNFLGARVAQTHTRARLVGPRLVKQPLLPRTAADTTLQSLVDSVKGLATETGGPIVQFLGSVLLQPTGRTVSTTLQRQGTAPDRLGLTFGIADLRDSGAPVFITLPEAKSRAPASTSPLGSTNPGLGPPVRSTLVDAASDLEEALLLQEAMTLLKDALATPTEAWVDPTPQLAQLLRSFNSQAAAITALKTGKSLEDSGHQPEAIAAYVEALPPAYRVEATEVWGIAIGADPDAAGQALLWLAAAYRERAFLADETQDLLRQASNKGAADAEEIRAAVNEADAIAIVSAARRLSHIQRYGEAKTFVARAIKLDPRNADGAELQARLLSLSPEEDESSKTATAQLALAEIYVETGRKADAQTAFKAALTSKPQLEAGRVGLRTSLESDQSLDERLTSLMPAAAWLLALELLRLELTRTGARRWWANISPFEVLEHGLPQVRSDYQRRNLGLILNYIAIFLQSSRGHPTLGMEFLDRAERTLLGALELIPDFYQPHENLADTYLFKAKKIIQNSGGRTYEGMSPSDRDEVDSFVARGIDAYREGLKILAASPLEGTPDGTTARRLLQVDLAVALLMPGTHRDVTEARGLVAVAGSNWSARSETSARVLYNFACAMGRLRQVDPLKGRYVARGRSMLALSMGRDADHEYWSESNDPDLIPLLENVSLPRLQRALKARDRCLYQAEAEIFVATIVDVMKEAGWLQPELEGVAHV